MYKTVLIKIISGSNKFVASVNYANNTLLLELSSDKAHIAGDYINFWASYGIPKEDLSDNYEPIEI